MRRLILLAVILFGALWMSAGPSRLFAPGFDTAIAASGVTHSSQDTGDSELQWRSGSQAIAPLPGSLWKDSTVHASLAHAPASGPVTAAPVTGALGTRALGTPAPGTPAPPYLRHTPLLI